MSLIEWWLWRWGLRRNRQKCARVGHDITGPYMCADGHYRYTCTRCVYRFRADETLRDRPRIELS